MQATQEAMMLDDDEERLVAAGDVLSALEVRDGPGIDLEDEPTGLPQDHHKERSVLSACLLDPMALDTARDCGVRDEHFTLAKHAALWGSIVAVADAGSPVDLATVCEHLERADKLHSIGGAAFVSHVQAQLVSVAFVGVYARSLVDLAARRDIIKAAARLTRDARKLSVPIVDVVERVQAAVMRIGDGGERESEDMRALTNAYLAHRAKAKGDGQLSTGFHSLDEALQGGLTPGRLTLIAARPGMGKSALAQQIAENACLHAGVAFFSCEMPSLEIAERGICRLARVPVHESKERKHDDKMTKAAGDWADLPIHIIEAAGMRLGEILSRARRLAAKGVGLVVVDHAGLVVADDKTENTNHEVGLVSKSLKRLALTSKICVVLLCQLNREVEKRQQKIPQLSDLRDSGNLEQDADQIVFLYREEYYRKEETSRDKVGMAEVIIAKQRGGPTGSVNMRFNGPLMSFSDNGTATTRRN